MTVGAPLVGALRGRSVSRLSRRSTSPRPAPGRTPVPVGAEDDAAPDAAPDADPSRRLESRRSTLPGSVVPSNGRRTVAPFRGRATTRVAPTSRSTAVTRWAPLMDIPAQDTPTPSKTWDTPGGGTFLSPSSPRLLSLDSGGAGVGRIGGGTFLSPRGRGGRKTPSPFLAGFRRTGAGGGAPVTASVPLLGSKGRISPAF